MRCITSSLSTNAISTSIWVNLRLAIRPQVLIAEAAGDLVVPLESADHQELLKHLRRLGQCVNSPRVNATRHNEVLSPSGWNESKGRLNLEEMVFIEEPPHFLHHLMAQSDRVLQIFAAQVQIAILQAQTLIHIVGAVDLKR